MTQSRVIMQSASANCVPSQAKVVVDLALPWLLDSQAQAEDIILVSFGLWHHDQTVYW